MERETAGEAVLESTSLTGLASPGAQPAPKGRTHSFADDDCKYLSFSYLPPLILPALGLCASDVTRNLQAIDDGEPHAGHELLDLVYDELRQSAAVKLSHRKPCGRATLFPERSSLNEAWSGQLLSLFCASVRHPAGDGSDALKKNAAAWAKLTVSRESGAINKCGSIGRV